MLLRLSLGLTITSIIQARFLQEEDQASCLEKKLFFFADDLCQPCESRQHADLETGTACIAETCTDDLPHLDMGGYCISCSEENTFFVETSRTCVVDNCLNNEVFQTVDGSCLACGDLETNILGDCVSCFQSTEIFIEADGTCQTCPTYSYPNTG